jgi:primosomal protein N' (replication factor Y)
MFAHVALPLPVFPPYTYRVPEGLADRVRPGARVVVPLRQRELVGIVTGVDVPAPAVEARDILAAPEGDPSLTPQLLETAGWVARHYGAPLGLAIRAMLPAGLWGHSSVVVRVVSSARVGGVAGELLAWLDRRGGEALLSAAARALKRPLWEVADRLSRIGAVELEVRPAEVEVPVATERVVRLSGEPLTLLERGRRFAGSPRRRALYEAVEQLGGAAPWRHLTGQLGFGDALVRSAVGSGVLTVGETTTTRDPFAGEPVTPPPTALTADQQVAVQTIAGIEPGSGALLFGVTGSGKTLVYIELIRAALAEGRGAILLVPEIALTPQTVSRLRGAFGDEVAVLHSGLSDGERSDAWQALRRGERRVAIGARSAVFAPVLTPGVIVVDEEQEASYKNGETPRYHARDVAAVRARLEGARLVLGSATPSLESMSRVGPHLIRVELPRRVHARPMPEVTLVDLRRTAMVRKTAGVPWSEILDEAVRETLDRGEQVLLLLNRRGYSAFLQCPSCGVVPECPNCSISLTVHRTPPVLRCHYCDHRKLVPTSCEACGHPVQSARGVGTQQLEAVVGERFPAARVARMDLDTTSARWSHQRILGAVLRREVDVLLGTQMIAKGIDLPEVTLVGVVDADVALHLPDFRAAERTFQLLAQVAGRAGRGDRPGRVVVQTRQPDHHALIHASRQDTEGFVEAELALRKEPAYPPETSLVNLVVSGPGEAEVSARAASLADWCAAADRRFGLGLTVLGPAPCPLTRLRGRWRWHVVLKGEGGALGRLVRALAPRLGPGPVRVALDRDPVTLL